MAKQYQVLARKCRPQQFDDVVGQEHITTTLQNAIAQNRLAHAYLFVGPRGIGKTSTARIFAKALNCEKGPIAKPCGVCDNCKEITAGNSLDVLEIDGASNNGVEQVRELRETCRYAPARARFKIYIIDEVHMLSNAAFNALLKTLEEPPAHVKFLFATTEPQKVLPTILSRCQRFDLRRIPANLIVKRLKEVAKGEKVTIEEKALTAIARGAEGGLRDAECALDQLIAFCGDTIREEDVLQVFGLVAHDQLAAITDAIIDGVTPRALELLKQLDDQGKDLQRLLAELLEHFRNLLVYRITNGATASLDVPDTTLELIKTQAGRVDSDAVLRMIDALAGAEARLRYALSKRIFFEIALIKAIKSRELVGIDGVLQKLNQLKSGLGAPPSAPAAAAPATAEARSEIALHPAGSASSPAAAARAATTGPSGSLDEAWSYAVDHLGIVNPMGKSYLVGTRLLGLRGNTVVVAFDPEFADRMDFIEKGRNLELLQGKLREKLHAEVMLKFEVAETSEAVARPTPSVTQAAAEARPTPSGPEPSVAPKGVGDFREDPLIKKALEIFKGTIVEVRE